VFVNTTLYEIEPAPASTRWTLTESALSAHWPAGAFGSVDAVGVGVGVGAGVAVAVGDDEVAGGVVGVAGEPEQPARPASRRAEQAVVTARADRRISSG
jgi:hypothetical protein